ncbi:MAG: hypothetical protein ACYTG6_09505, partial [Planctomycetota bacterium]
MSATLGKLWCAIQVTLHVEFQNKTDVNTQSSQTLPKKTDIEFAAKVKDWISWIEDFWNGPNGERTWNCCRVRFEVDARVAGS